MELKDYEYRTGDMSAYICVEKYLLHHGFKKTLAELQSYKPLIVYDYLKKSGYEMAEVFLEKSTKTKRKREEQVEPNPPKRAKQDQEPSQSDSEEEELNRLVPIRNVFEKNVLDILKDLMSNPGLHHVAETIIGYLDRKLALELVDKRELLSEEERKFLMKTLRRKMFNEAKQICDKTYTFANSTFHTIYIDDDRDDYDECWTYGGNITKSIFQMYPFFIEALHDLKTSETLESLKQMGKILLLLEDVINEDSGFKLRCLNYIDPNDKEQDSKGPSGFKLTCLNNFIDPNNQDAKGPEDMIMILQEGANLFLSETYYDDDLM